MGYHGSMPIGRVRGREGRRRRPDREAAGLVQRQMRRSSRSKEARSAMEEGSLAGAAGATAAAADWPGAAVATAAAAGWPDALSSAMACPTRSRGVAAPLLAASSAAAASSPLRIKKVRIIRVVGRGNLHMCKQWLWWLKGKQRLLHGNTQLSDDRRSARSCTRDKLVNEGNSKRKRLKATFEVSWEPGSSFSPPVEHTTSATMFSDIKVFSISESNNTRLCPLLLQDIPDDDRERSN